MVWAALIVALVAVLTALAAFELRLEALGWAAIVVTVVAVLLTTEPVL
jgi:hypothetical protein